MLFQIFQLFDINGKAIATMPLELNVGINQFEYDGSQLINGFYSCRIGSKSSTASGKLIVMK